MTLAIVACAILALVIVRSILTPRLPRGREQPQPDARQIEREVYEKLYGGASSTVEIVEVQRSRDELTAKRSLREGGGQRARPAGSGRGGAQAPEGRRRTSAGQARR